MRNRLHLYVTKDTYDSIAGPDWPSYEKYCLGEKAQLPHIQQEIDDFTEKWRQNDVIFPIKTKTACQSKWTWSTIYLNQLSSGSCHRVDPEVFSLEDFDNFHNLPGKLKQRQIMLKGEWPTSHVNGCDYCQRIEESGGFSDRMHNLSTRGLTPPEVEIDPTAIVVTPRIVEIFAQNTCNLQCIYCNATLSSKIEQENKKVGDFQHGGVHIPLLVDQKAATKEYFAKFVNWLERNIQHLRRLHLCGGETFIQHELQETVLGLLEKIPAPNLTLNIFSNMNVPDKWWDLYTGRIQDLQRRGHIQYFDLNASIDCWGEAASYVRSGLDLKKFEERFRWAAEQDPSWLRFNINQTVTCMTIKTMPELIDLMNRHGRDRPIGHYFQFYIGPQKFQHPDIMSWDFWEKDFDAITSKMYTETESDLDAYNRMQGLIKVLQQTRNIDWQRVRNLHIYLDELDRRRGTNWRRIFPYLDIHDST